MKTYKAMEIKAPNSGLQLVERPMRDPGPGQVRIKVEACGVCHSDSIAMEGLFPIVKYPIVPGHEIVGRIDAIGSGVHAWKVGDRVGAGWFGGECGYCETCRRGLFINCPNLMIPGITIDGGYAESVILEARALASIPNDITPDLAAPLLCAGVTTYNALRNAKLRAGDVVGIQGIGGLGHLGIQFARRMGFHTVAIARGREKEALALKLGAHQYIDSTDENAVQTFVKTGGANAILATASSGKSMGPLLDWLKPRGKLIIVGAALDPVEFMTPQILLLSKTIQGEASGTAIDISDTLQFSHLQQVRPMIEVMPLEKAPDAYAKMMQNEARFRMVLKT